MTLNLIDYTPKVMREDEQTMLPSLLSSFGRCRHRPCGACMPVFVWSTRCCPRVEASGSRVDGLLHNDGDKATAVIPRHTSSVATSLFIDHHPHHHHPCRPHPLFHHCCRRSPATLVTISLSLTALIVSAFIIGNVLCCSSPPAVVLVSTARLQHSRC